MHLDGKLALAVPAWLERVHTDLAAFGGLPVIDGGTLWFNAWSVANLLEWADTAAFGELEPLRLRMLAMNALENGGARLRSPAKKTELTLKIAELSKIKVGRYSKERYVPRHETMRRQLGDGIESK
jgi:hypothetical protein